MSIVEDKIANPLKFYNRPIEVEYDSDLSLEDKIKLLTNWLDDIRLRQIAEAENMVDGEQPPTYIAEVEHLLHKYQVEELGQRKQQP
ncbi:Uncharacterised protein [Legionella londiniensis]|uniref:Uncharacterized protein n=2 Tax=Legionella londiniensis TaxID=45068 RepID=A0A0W0VLV8_9GAMM|nr:hypothetical protein Llon_1185 [Legionella londiniensis]STX93663.1 Uncharacterised protein [Legionella londiniensis]